MKNNKTSHQAIQTIELSGVKLSMSGLFLRVSTVKVLITILVTTIAPWSLAFDSASLWLPKKYANVMPKLEAAAREAESGERCTLVIAGEMLLSKNTERDYYLVITCRDKNRRSYNLSYQAQKAGLGLVLLSEQRSSLSEKAKESLEIDDEGLTRELALELCSEALDDEAILIGWIEILAADISDLNYSPEWAYRFNMPFNSKNRYGELVPHNADCRIDEEGETDVETRIDINGIEKLCLRALDKSARLLLGMTILRDKISEIDTQEYNFSMQIPFDAKDPSGRDLHYIAQCDVNDAGATTIKLKARRD